MKLLYLFLPSHRPVLEVWPVFSSLLSTCFAGLYPSLWLLLWCPEWTRLAACHRWLDWSTNTGVERVKSWDVEKVWGVIKGQLWCFSQSYNDSCWYECSNQTVFLLQALCDFKDCGPSQPHWENINKSTSSISEDIKWTLSFQLELYAALRTINLDHQWPERTAC